MVVEPMTEAERELAFLRYFFQRARTGMGPSDGDIYIMIMEDYEEAFEGRVPEPYRSDYFGDDGEEE